jgi:hypothetical protein
VVDVLPPGPIAHLQPDAVAAVASRRQLSDSDLAAWTAERLLDIERERAELLRQRDALLARRGGDNGSEGGVGGGGDAGLLPAELAEIDRQLAALAAEETELRHGELLVAELIRHGMTAAQIATARAQHIERMRGSADCGDATDDELLAAHAYTLAQPPLFQLLNVELWSKRPNVARYEHFFSHLLESVKHIRGTDQDVYRGQPSLYNMSPSDLDVGKCMVWRGFNSVTTSQGVARNFAGYGPHPILYIIRGIKPYASAKFKLVSQFPGEEEVVLRPGVVFEVTHRVQLGGYDTVSLQFRGTLPQAIQRYRWPVHRDVQYRQHGVVEVDMVATDAADAAQMWRGSEHELLEGRRGVVWDEPNHVSDGACVIGPVSLARGRSHVFL